MACKIQPRIGARAALVGIVATVGVLAGVSRVNADPENLTTSTAVAPGGMLSVNETVSGVNIASSTAIATCPLSGLDTDIVVYTCEPFGPGIPSGTQIQQTFTAVSGTTLPQVVPVTVTYNANGPLPAKPASVSESSAACTRDPSPPPASTYPTAYGYADPTVFDCSVSTNAVTDQLQALTIHVSHQPWSDFAPGDIGILTAPSTLGTCARLTTSPGARPVYGTLPAFSRGPGTDIVIQYSCGRQQSIPDSTNIDLIVFGQFITTVHPAIQEDANQIVADVGIPAVAAVPAPTTQALFGPNPPQLFTVDPASAPPGATVTLTGTDLREFAFSFGGTPGVGTTIGPSGGTTVNFGTLAATDVVCDPSGETCTATVPAADPGTVVSVTVTNSAGTSNGQPFGFMAPPPPGSLAPSGVGAPD